MEKPYVHMVLVCEPVADKPQFNQESDAREVVMLTAMGASGLLPNDISQLSMNVPGVVRWERKGGQ